MVFEKKYIKTNVTINVKQIINQLSLLIYQYSIRINLSIMNERLKSSHKEKKYLTAL